MVANLLRRPSITRARTLPGAPLIPYIRASRYSGRPWLRVPIGWPGSNLEWYVWWYLSIYGIEPSRRKLVPGRDFFWQKAQGAPGLFIGRNFTRADFVIPHWPGAPMGIILDPLTSFTHASIWHDLRKRQVLIGMGWRLIFLDGPALTANPRTVIEAALRGVDTSKRGKIA
jgi:hypothetical protein